MHIFQEQHFDSAFRVRKLGVKFVDIENLIKAWGNVIRLAGYFRAADIFCEGVKFVGKSRLFDFEICIAVTNYVYIAFQLDVANSL